MENLIPEISPCSDESIPVKQIPKLEYIVIDAGAIIRGHAFNLPNLCKCICTVQEVIGEIRDSKSRNLLTTLPYEIEILSPSEAAMKSVIEFSRKTGDFAALSLTDLKLIALTFTLESRINGQIDMESKLKKLYLQRASSSAVKNKQAMNNENTAEQQLHNTRSNAGATDEENELVVLNQELSSKNSGDFEKIDDTGDDYDENEYEESDENHSSDTDDDSGDELNDDNHEADEEENSKNLSVEGGRVFDEGEFPSLGSSSPAAATEAAVAKPPNWSVSSWASMAAKPATLHPPLPPVESLTIGSTARVSNVKIENDSLVESQQKMADLSTKPVVTPSSSSYSSSSSSSSRILTNTHLSSGNKASSNSMLEEDDGSGWINPTNISVCRANGSIAMDTSVITIKTSLNNDDVNDNAGWSQAVSKASKKNHNDQDGKSARNSKHNNRKVVDMTKVKVACITTDFSIQNVMLQIGLHLMSIEGMLIERVKQWVLRCVGCFQIHYDLTRLFCSKCGGSCLTRVAVSIHKNTGKLKLHLKANYQVNLRGTIYSLPKPGKSTNSVSDTKSKFNGELLLREDQLLSGVWKQKYMNSQRKVKLNNGDVFKDSEFGLSKIHHVDDIIVGYGKKNPNSMKGRERRGKKKM